MSDSKDHVRKDPSNSEEQYEGLYRQCRFCLDVVAFCSCLVEDLMGRPDPHRVLCPSCGLETKICFCSSTDTPPEGHDQAKSETESGEK